ncbi:MAG TPA: hypothetical protein VNO70_12810 [Blastocatellia bacterium]|nr:hypothetical protein [Blastocatellia bacterium]
MSEAGTLAPLILAKVREQVERADRLAALVPAGATEWRPLPDAMRVCDLLGHLLECLGGFCAALYALHPDRLAHFASLRELPVNHCCGVAEARSRMREYLARIEEGFALITDNDLARRLPTVFVAEGEASLTILLGNLEHFINHKYQLFFYLKLLGVEVSTPDLYQLRGM